MSGEWLAACGLLAVIFGPGIVAMLRGARPADRRARRADAERYGRRGYEALDADEVDAAWRDSLPDVARRMNPAIPPPETKPLPAYRGVPL